MNWLISSANNIKDKTMKYLSHYVEAKQTELFNQCGAFFAFSQQQFNDAIKEGVQYVSLGAGLICVLEHKQTLVDGLETITADGIAQDLAENSIDAIIKRELFNYESFYNYDISDTVDALKPYGISRVQIQAVFDRVAPTVEC
jgi:hypothetical protein